MRHSLPALPKQSPGSRLDDERAREAERALRACTNCGLCLPACPTYRLLGNELDSPRGRIHLMKAMLEGEAVSAVTRMHLDRCLACRACETACPSGVEYHQLLTVGRQAIEQRVPRPWRERLRRWCMRRLLPRRRWAPLLRLAQTFRFLLPLSWQGMIPRKRPRLRLRFAKGARRVVGKGANRTIVYGIRDATAESDRHAKTRCVILAQGCMQSAFSPNTAAAAVKVLNALGIEVLTAASESCCGALSCRLNAQDEGLDFARRAIDAWLPLLDNADDVDGGAEAIVITASACSLFARDYGRVLAADSAYADKAARIAEKVRDISQILIAEDLTKLRVSPAANIAWHCPCTAQHGQALAAPTRAVLQRLGFAPPLVADSNSCCGATGIYPLSQPALAQALRRQTLAALQSNNPQQIITADPACQSHLSPATNTPVLHWIELVARSMA